MSRVDLIVLVNSIYESNMRVRRRDKSCSFLSFIPIALTDCEKLDYLRVVTIQISLGLKTHHAVVRFRKCRRG